MVGRRIVVIRHGERVDFTFTDEWMKTSFSSGNTYIKTNLNMPDSVPKRRSPSLFRLDCPLTQVGEFQAMLTGKGLLEEGVLREGFKVFVSPALRCVQTAKGIGKGMNMDFSMKVEPCLFEWMGWFRDYVPKWMTVEEYRENGFNIDTSHVPYKVDLSTDEDLTEVYDRAHRFVQHAINSTDQDILLVGHALSLDTLSRQLTGRLARTMPNMMNFIRNVPYCGSCVIELDEKSNKWSVVPVPKLTMKHGTVHDFAAINFLSQDKCPDVNRTEHYHT